MIRERLIGYFEQSIRQNWDIEALSNYKEKGYSYKEIAARILKFHIFFRDIGIKEGDKIALVGRNSANWCISYLATVSYGAVIVPILPDFKPDDLMNLINHSDSCFMFSDDKIFETLDPGRIPLVAGVLSLDSFTLILSGRPNINEAFSSVEGKYLQAYPELKPEHIKFSDISNDKLAVISYTGGTTGFSKGVMISHNSLAANVRFAQKNMPLSPGDPLVSFLPLAHTYGCAFEFLFPFTLGCDITFLTKTPSPKVIMQAFQEIRPALILSVPLVIEKIYKTQILPAFRNPALKILIRIPLLKNLLYKKIRQKLYGVFGGNFRELVIGGAPFNTQAEQFFKKMKFPFTVGYGMTECGPLISYASWKTTKLGASGRAVDELQVRIDSDDPVNVAGEILIKGSHVMLGYYKNEEATKAVIDNDGWLHSGDLGVIDKDGNIYIRGRSKSMILGPSGKNIYPEEIESVLNNRFMVMESLVIERHDKLTALIYPDYDAAEKAGHTKEELPEIFKAYIHDLNHHLPKYIRIADFEIVSAEFEKTPKRSIKRFLYC